MTRPPQTTSFSPEFKDATTHDPNGITLLCPNHHARKTKGLLSKESIIRRNSDPEALRQGFVNEELDLCAEELTLFIGTLCFKNTLIVIQLGDEPILSVSPGDEEDEPYQLSATLRDRKGNIILEIDNNEWKIPATHWDCKTIGNRLQIRSGPGEIELIIRHVPPDELHIERLRMIHRGFIIEAHESKFTKFITPDGSVTAFKNSTIDNWTIGLHLFPNGDAILGDNAREGGGRLSPGEMVRYHITDPPHTNPFI